VRRVSLLEHRQLIPTASYTSPIHPFHLIPHDIIPHHTTITIIRYQQHNNDSTKRTPPPINPLSNKQIIPPIPYSNQ
jgi:hypothetical protein